MATKDWKKTNEQRNFVRYHNIINMNYIEVAELTESTVKGKWSIELRKDTKQDDAVILKSLGIAKSRAEALKLAKKYMEAH